MALAHALLATGVELNGPVARAQERMAWTLIGIEQAKHLARRLAEQQGAQLSARLRRCD